MCRIWGLACRALNLGSCKGVIGTWYIGFPVVKGLPARSLKDNLLPRILTPHPPNTKYSPDIEIYHIMGIFNIIILGRLGD